MTKTKTNVPRLRFSEFDGEWKNDILENNINFVQGNDGTDKSLPVLTISAGKGWMNQKDRFGTVLAGNELKNYTLLKKGQMSYNHGNSKLAEYGAVFCLRNYDKALVPKVYHSFELKNGDPNFMEKLFESKIPDRQLRKLITSGARMDGLLNINKKSFGSISLNFPSQYEQQKIGSFFVKIDKLIELQTLKLEQLKKLKQGYLQKMFPQDGESVPRLRFSGFSGEWKERKLGDYLKLPKLEEVEVKNSNAILSVKLNLKGIVRLGEDTTLKLGSTKYYKRRKNQFIYGKQNFFNGSMAIIPERYDGLVSSGDVPSFDVKGINPEFLLLFVSRKDYFKHYEKYANGTGSKRIHENVLLNFDISVPTKDEQDEITNFFKILNNQINNESKKLDSLNNQKKAYLQKMFI